MNEFCLATMRTNMFKNPHNKSLASACFGIISRLLFTTGADQQGLRNIDDRKSETQKLGSHFTQFIVPEMQLFTRKW